MADSIGTKRLFIGIELPNSLKSELSKAKARVEVDINGRWINPMNLHLTLKFLGDCDLSLVEHIDEILAKVAGSKAPFYLRTTEFGCFPSSNKARILWLGLAGDQRIERLQNEIEEATADLGFRAEKKKFHPHITLARFKHPGKIDLDKLNNLVKIDREFMVSFLNLYESILSPKGANYTVLRKFKLLA